MGGGPGGDDGGDRRALSRDPALLGLYHVTNAGQATWLELAREIFRQAGMAVTVEPTTTAEYGAKAPRPAFSALAHGHLERAGIPSPRPWPEALAGVPRLARLNAGQPPWSRSRGFVVIVIVFDRSVRDDHVHDHDHGRMRPVAEPAAANP